MASEEEVSPFPAGSHLCPEPCQRLLDQKDGGRIEKNSCFNRHSEVLPLSPHAPALPPTQEWCSLPPEEVEGSSGKSALPGDGHGSQGYSHPEQDPWLVGEVGVPANVVEGSEGAGLCETLAGHQGAEEAEGGRGSYGWGPGGWGMGWWGTGGRVTSGRGG